MRSGDPGARPTGPGSDPWGGKGGGSGQSSGPVLMSESPWHFGERYGDAAARCVAHVLYSLYPTFFFSNFFFYILFTPGGCFVRGRVGLLAVCVRLAALPATSSSICGSAAGHQEHPRLRKRRPRAPTSISLPISLSLFCCDAVGGGGSRRKEPLPRVRSSRLPT
ncbi:hypothetical protein LZ31DRAFT_217982 [Colletotrichum somersetense]|nr:hypothetical protein LZ31DRAFT_217982 [Colletotrichum somersetense]